MKENNQKPTALVTGGSRGLGSAIIEDFYKRGFNVATFSRSISKDIQAFQKEYGSSFLWKQIDGNDYKQAIVFVKEIIDHFQTLDILVNNAGVGHEGPLTLMANANIDALLDINLKLSIYLAKACIKQMLRQQSGCIVNISSVNAIRGHAGISVYSATKSALDGFTRSLAREVGPQGIRVNSLAPGYFLSEMTQEMGENARNRIIRRTPLGRLGSIEDLVHAVRFLTSEESAFITGQTLIVDGGLTS
ncbi:MAG: SDR family oxidoreductase [Spirochaetota bacterium]